MIVLKPPAGYLARGGFGILNNVANIAQGGVPERLNGLLSKSSRVFAGSRGFESHHFRR